MTQTTAFKTPEGEAAFLAAYEAAISLWPVPYEEVDIPSRFGSTHVAITGPKDAPPLVVLHGYLATLTMWSQNIADFSKDYRVYAIDVMGQPSKSVPDPDKPIRNAQDFVAWLSETLDGLNLDRVSLVGMSYGGWLALNFAIISPERVQKVALLSPASSFQPLTRQFGLRAFLMGVFPTRLTVNSCFGWMGFKDTFGDDHTKGFQVFLDLAYFGMKHFKFPVETIQIMPGVFSDEELRSLQSPVLLLIGDHEVIYDPAKALDRARRLIPNIEGDLVPHCNHDMVVSQNRIVNTRVLDFLEAS